MPDLGTESYYQWLEAIAEQAQMVKDIWTHPEGLTPEWEKELDAAREALFALLD